MCDPISAGIVLGAAQGALGVRAQNEAIRAQMEDVNRQAAAATAENQYRTAQEKKQALESGYVAAQEKTAAADKALVRTTTLGIRGVSAGEKVSEELRVGSYNVGSAVQEYQDADTAGQITDINTKNAVDAKQKALQEQFASPFEALFATAAGGLQGYLGGQQVATAAGYEGTPFYKKLFGKGASA